MPDVYQEIRDWLRARPDWQQQAAEILLASGVVSDAHILSLAQRLKTPEGQQVTSHRTFASLGPTAVTSQALRLVEIGGISGIENLNPRNPLAFGDGTTPLRLVELNSASETQLVRIGIRPLAERSTGALRVEPHPAWDRTFARVAFNACPEGKRRVYVADLADILRAG